MKTPYLECKAHCIRLVALKKVTPLQKAAQKQKTMSKVTRQCITIKAMVPHFVGLHTPISWATVPQLAGLRTIKGSAMVQQFARLRVTKPLQATMDFPSSEMEMNSQRLKSHILGAATFKIT